MNVIVCLDDRNGMMFNNRRQSRDQAVRMHMAKLAKSSRLWMNSYSYGQFKEEKYQIVTVDEEFLLKAAKGEYCFVENQDLGVWENKIEQLILYKWNRSYPSDFYLNPVILSVFNKQLAFAEFKGNSHDKISQEVYGR